ncbi:MAG: hypothetical protein COY40_06495 [Alphaproteobacteria bacterium CG_4_10_14_0_8_um_filter_53_9]|nr:MAG: hypothetical protein COY40_06495 [Alphaproteobacteria bacterium CG_4_10_14_0_8_um_filter_53_9]
MSDDIVCEVRYKRETYVLHDDCSANTLSGWGLGNYATIDGMPNIKGFLLAVGLLVNNPKYMEKMVIL